MALVSFIRGSKDKYVQSKMKNGIYFATDTNSIIMGNEEYGLYPKYFSFPNKGEIIEKQVLSKNKSLDLQPYSVNTSIDFSNGEYLQFEINLASCSQSHNIELLAIGNNISTISSADNTLRFYYSHNNEFTDGNNLAIYYYGDNTIVETLTTSDTLSIKVGQDGLYINGFKRGTITASTLSNFLSLTNIVIGSARTDDKSLLSDATYTKMSIYKVIGDNEPTLSYLSTQNETKLVNLPLATQVQCGMMSKDDKIIVDTLSQGNNDYGTY